VSAFALSLLSKHACESSDLLQLVRQADGKSVDDAALHRLRINVKFAPNAPEREQVAGFFACYDVVAESLDEARCFVAAMGEGALVTSTPQIDQTS
jgi:hypothetical protein